MPKLSKDYRFFDISDYGREPAVLLAQSLKNTWVSPVHVTFLFGMVGLCAVYSILQGSFWIALALLILKSILDAADGELSRVRNRPSFIGRYLDSIFDILINILLIWSIWQITNIHIIWPILAFVGIQLQGTLYNYYYVILRNKVKGDRTSRIFETSSPEALKGESQKTVNTLFYTYKLLYSAFDKSIQFLDPNAPKSNHFPNWFMTCLSFFGLGAQLLIIGLMLVCGLQDYILIFFTYLTLLVFLFILVRRGLT